jgi:hypothetical protein
MKNNSSIVTIVLAGLLLSCLYNCKKEDVKFAPVVSISAVTSVTANGALSGGEILGESSLFIITKGVCWSNFQNPTIAQSKTSDGWGTGSFTSSIKGLTPGVTYYIRAYVTTSAGTVYSSQLTFTTLPGIPVLTTMPLSDLTIKSATGGGYISSNSGAEVTERGICWSNIQNPTIADSRTSDGIGSGKFSSALAGLSPVKIYYIRAYATNRIGTGYGDQVAAITSSNSPIITNGSFAILQKATKGNGVDLVFMGDGYRAVEIYRKIYADNINQAFSWFFDIEPYKSYSAYFNVYMVYAFSEESGISDLFTTIKTRFQTKFEGENNAMTTNINTCRDFALKAPIRNIENTVAVLIANSPQYGGTTYIHSGQTGFNVSICPRPFNFSNYVVEHEAGGHGFGNLADEYMNNNTVIPQSQIDYLLRKQSYGIFLNVDVTDNLEKIRWRHFIGLPKYTYVNAFQGGFLYSLGVWRPEMKSLMTENIKYFNAPCREIIVKRIMKLAGLPYSFADFQAKDIMELPTKAAIVSSKKSFLLAPPIIY